MTPTTILGTTVRCIYKYAEAKEINLLKVTEFRSDKSQVQGIKVILWRSG